MDNRGAREPIKRRFGGNRSDINGEQYSERYALPLRFAAFFLPSMRALGSVGTV